MAHVVEETFDIKVYNKMQMLYLHKRIGHCHGIFLAAVWAKPKAAVVEFRFANGFQNLQEALLDKPVLDSRDSQGTGPSRCPLRFPPLRTGWGMYHSSRLRT